MPNASNLDNLSTNVGVNFRNLGELVSVIVRYAFPIAGLLLLVYLIYGGFKLLVSQGDPKAVESGKQIITNAAIGFVVIFVAFWIMQAIGIALGVNVIGQMFGGS